MFVSVFADASLCPKERVAAWGAWVKSDRGVAYEGAAFRGLYYSSGDAELHAIVNAVHLALRTAVAARGDTLLVQSDCAEALQALTGEAPTSVRRRPEMRRGLRAMRSIERRCRLKIRYRHVKGHSDDGAPRSWANDKCHEMAKTMMRRARRGYVPTWGDL